MTSALVVDDIKENLYLFEALLKGHGYEVQTAANGKAALESARNKLPDIIISDILMPTMDGFTFCSECKNDSQLRHIPFVFYTATYTDPKDELFALSLGADAFLVKPIDPMELFNKISDIVASHIQKKPADQEENDAVQPVNLKEYNEILIHKLEKKMAELDIINKELQESESRFRRLAESSPALIYRVSLPEFRVNYINPISIELTGYTPDEFYQNPSLIHDYLLNPIWQGNRENSFTHLQAGELLPCFEYQINHKSEGTKWVQLRVVLIKDENGHITSIEGILIDQTENYLSKQALQESETRYRNLNADLERRVQERTAQLEAANQELEAFSFSVSHDLRAPLRAMNGFSTILLNDYADQLDSTGQGYLMRICSGSQRMKQLIDDLLNLSRVTRAELNKTQVNLSDLAFKQKNAISETQPERQVTWKITPDILVNGDKGLLDVALGNMLDNAFKFTAQHEKATIEFSSCQLDGQTVYFVRDDGVGFDMASSNKLFAAFQRLPTARSFDGIGIGLTIVQRIIARHGGRIWAESQVDQGTTFYFTLG